MADIFPITIKRGQTYTRYLVASAGADLTAAECAAQIKVAVEGDAPADASPVVAAFDVTKVDHWLSDDLTSPPAFRCVLSAIQTAALQPEVDYVMDAKVTYNGEVKYTDTELFQVDQRVTGA